MLKHLGSLTKHAETALVCAVDICRAAMYVCPEDEVPLRVLAYDVVHEIKVSAVRKCVGKAHRDNFSSLHCLILLIARHSTKVMKTLISRSTQRR